MQAFEPPTQLNISIRPAKQQDLEAIGSLWVELMAFHAQLDPRFHVPAQGRTNYIRHIHNALRDDNFRVLVADHNGRILGYVMGYVGQNPPIFPQPRFGFIADLCVTQTCRRQGVGVRLVRAICQWFRTQGMQNVQLNVAHNNPLSQAFWRKVGCTDYLDHMWMDLSE